VALDLQGKVVWDREVGPYESIQGYSASPALHQSLLVIPVDGSLGNTLHEIARQRRHNGGDDDDHRQHLDEDGGIFDPHQDCAAGCIARIDRRKHESPFFLLYG
jgi:hypothetical protein